MNQEILSASLWDAGSNVLRESLRTMPEQPAIAERRGLNGDQQRLLSSVRVELSIEIGKVGLTLADLLDLSAGARVEFSLPEELPVTLGIDGVPIAQGRIIYENDMPFVEILELDGAVTEGGNTEPQSNE